MPPPRTAALRVLAAGGATLYAQLLYHDTEPPEDETSRPGRPFPFTRSKRRLPSAFGRPAECAWKAPAYCFLKTTDLQVPFERHYALGPKLGEGAFATVHLCVDKQSSAKAAVKVFEKEQLTPEAVDGIKEEMEIMKSLSHPNIVRVIGSYEDQKRFYLVIELCQGGELFDRIIAKRHYNEKEARDVIRTLLYAISYCHAHSVVHRDIKPENLLLTSHDDDVSIKITDFGIAGRLYGPNCLDKNVGTPGYTAPEILKGEKYDASVDCWSIGVIAFILLGGYTPFGSDESDVLEGRYDFHSPEWDHVSEEAKDLIRKLLLVDPKQRLTAKEALAHPWIRAQDDVLADRELSYTQRGIESMRAHTRLREAVGAVLNAGLQGAGLAVGAR